MNFLITFIKVCLVIFTLATVCCIKNAKTTNEALFYLGFAIVEAMFITGF